MLYPVFFIGVFLFIICKMEKVASEPVNEKYIVKLSDIKNNKARYL